MSSPTPGYAEVIDLIRSNERVETKIDLVLKRLDSQDAEINSIHLRVEELEKARPHNRGVLAVLTAIGGIVGGVASALVKAWLPH